MNHFLKTGANPLVYVMLCGRMTPEQKEIVKKRARLDIQKMKDLLEWFINKSGHPGYEGVTPPSECPQPNIIADNDTTNNTDQRYPHRKWLELSMRELGLSCLVQGENTSWALPDETLRPGAQLQCPWQSHSLRATIEGQQRTTHPRHVGLPSTGTE